VEVARNRDIQDAQGQHVDAQGGIMSGMVQRESSRVSKAVPRIVCKC
jgi:hypothetical protein